MKLVSFSATHGVLSLSSIETFGAEAFLQDPFTGIMTRSAVSKFSKAFEIERLRP
jgi:hypothetical protein